MRLGGLSSEGHPPAGERGVVRAGAQAVASGRGRLGQGRGYGDLLPRTWGPPQRSKLGGNPSSPVSTRTTHSRTQTKQPPGHPAAETGETMEGTRGSQPLSGVCGRLARLPSSFTSTKCTGARSEKTGEADTTWETKQLPSRSEAELLQRLFKPNLTRRLITNS